jgi:hypothetical protein
MGEIIMWKEEFSKGEGEEIIYTKTNANGKKSMLYITPNRIYRVFKNGGERDASLWFHNGELHVTCGGDPLNVRHLAHRSGILDPAVTM